MAPLCGRLLGPGMLKRLRFAFFMEADGRATGADVGLHFERTNGVELEHASPALEAMCSSALTTGLELDRSCSWRHTRRRRSAARERADLVCLSTRRPPFLADPPGRHVADRARGPLRRYTPGAMLDDGCSTEVLLRPKSFACIGTVVSPLRR